MPWKWLCCHQCMRYWAWNYWGLEGYSNNQLSQQTYQLIILFCSLGFHKVEAKHSCHYNLQSPCHWLLPLHSKECHMHEGKFLTIFFIGRHLHTTNISSWNSLISFLTSSNHDKFFLTILQTVFMSSNNLYLIHKFLCIPSHEASKSYCSIMCFFLNI